MEVLNAAGRKVNGIDCKTSTGRNEKARRAGLGRPVGLDGWHKALAVRGAREESDVFPRDGGKRLPPHVVGVPPHTLPGGCNKGTPALCLTDQAVPV